MFYEFPKISHFSEIKNLVEKSPSMFVWEFADFDVVNYTYMEDDLFPDVDTLSARLYREMRGLVFDKNGNLIGRPYHKFFNMNEREEVLQSNIDFSADHHLMIKLDGSMVHAVLIGDTLHWITKKGYSDVSRMAAHFVENSPIKYSDFVKKWLKKGWSPIFEWLSPDQRIIIEYEHDNLVLTAIRHHETGEYKTVDELVEIGKMDGIPVINLWGIEKGNAETFAKIRKEKNIEGIVCRFYNGHMLKVKADSYTYMHSAMNDMSSECKMLTMLVTDSLDDFLPLLSDHHKKEVSQWRSDITESILQWMSDLEQKCLDQFTLLDNDRKNYSIQFASRLSGLEQAFAYNFVSGRRQNNWAQACAFIQKYSYNKNRIETVRPMFEGIYWLDYFGFKN